MFLPKTAEYALRSMAQIALLPWDATVRKQELSNLVDVPKDYLSKVLRKLTLAGLLIAEKGHGGGYKLALPPRSVTFLDVLKAVDFSFATNYCVSGWGKCNSKNPCPLHEVYSKLSSQIYFWAENTTLGDVNKTAEFLKKMSGRKVMNISDKSK